MFITTPLQAALEDSISSGKFIDTKFWVFDNLNRETGQVEQPRAVFTNSAVVTSVPHLGALLDGLPEGPLDAGFPQTTEESVPGEYEYQSDSDLSDGIAQSILPTPPSTPEQDQIAEGCRLSWSKLGRTVVIRDAAFVTLHAVLMYLYTKEIDFRAPDRIDARLGCSSGVPPPSAKSVYRLADKYGIPDLKELALLEIESGIEECDIIEESFEKFTSWYPEIQELYVDRLAQVLCFSDSPAIAAAFDAKIQEYFAGKLPHAKGTVLGLFDLLASNGMSPHLSPPRSSQPATTPFSDFDPESPLHLKNALTRSLTTGIFLDSMFYVEDPVERRLLFFCSSITPASFMKISEIGKLVPVGALHGGSEQMAPGGVNPIASQDATSQKALVVTLGNFRTWKSILLYIYTAKILFTPFGPSASPSIAGRLPNPRVSHEGVDTKLIYELATKIALKPLCDIAYENIELSMTSENIVEELLSPFSAGHEQIREMQCRLLREEFWSADTRKGLRTKIEQSDGQISHYGPAIVMVFRGLAQSKQTEEELEVIDKSNFYTGESSFYTGESSFYTERDETNRNVTLTYQTITTAPDLRNTSQEELRLAHYRQNSRTAKGSKSRRLRVGPFSHLRK